MISSTEHDAIWLFLQSSLHKSCIRFEIPPPESTPPGGICNSLNFPAYILHLKVLKVMVVAWSIISTTALSPAVHDTACKKGERCIIHDAGYGINRPGEVIMGSCIDLMKRCSGVDPISWSEWFPAGLHHLWRTPSDIHSSNGNGVSKWQLSRCINLIAYYISHYLYGVCF